MVQASQPLPYTASPVKLALYDLLLWARITFVWPPWAGIPSIVLPIWPFRSGALDELYPTPANLYSVVLQLIFTTLQAIFILSIPITAVLGVGFPFIPPFIGAYVPIWLTWIIGFVLTNAILSIVLLNGFIREFDSQTPLTPAEISSHTNEKWVFVNGVAAGSHWMQSNLDRLSLTFRREIHGIHNQTRGILFDLMECILERTFSYPTPATRIVYQQLLNIVSNPQYTKVILILHSQGAIQGGLALDWLYATVPASQLSRVEVYTFGSAANHFNNPTATTMSLTGHRIDLLEPESFSRILRHIEHYANSGDYVSKFGILNFRPLPDSMTRRSQTRGMRMFDPDADQEVENRYVGRLFLRSATGHQLNGNYLDNFFRMDGALGKVLDGNEFMDGRVDVELLEGDDIVVVRGEETREKVVGGKGGLAKGRNAEKLAGVRVKDVCRLWMYRNGMSPQD